MSLRSQYRPGELSGSAQAFGFGASVGFSLGAAMAAGDVGSWRSSCWLGKTLHRVAVGKEKQSGREDREGVGQLLSGCRGWRLQRQLLCRMGGSLGMLAVRGSMGVDGRAMLVQTCSEFVTSIPDCTG